MTRRHCCWREMERREFLKLTAAGALGAVAGGLPIPRLAGAATASTVVCVKGAGAMTGPAPSTDVALKMLEKALLTFTGKSSVKDAWKEFVSPKDIIGLKINCLGRKMLSTHPAFTDAVIKSLVAAGIDENNIVVWDRFGGQMQDGGYVLKSGTGVKFLASEGPQSAGYDEKVAYESTKDDPARRDKNGSKSFVSSILTQKTTAMINLPVLKNHVVAGVTLGLKNIGYGVTNNTGRLHKDYCDPFIAEVCAMPEVKGKYRLTILDALEACFDGGPAPTRPDLKWRPEMLYVATDMVALDATAAQVIDAKRQEKGLPPATRTAPHIATAAKLKLGTNVKEEIKVESLSV
ncbi:MAG: DUF362 domain-containing protein [Planctomycetes bacterium]|nr:DUF362 domain-containing protein [Planctomycetota bacterium]MBM4087092.1 DUF362 domain-containing protein [Planctomycetota bacterium]